VVGVTAAMPSGTGLNRAMEKFPDRFWDVAIAEQHAVTSMGALERRALSHFVQSTQHFYREAMTKLYMMSA